MYRVVMETRLGSRFLKRYDSADDFDIIRCNAMLSGKVIAENISEAEAQRLLEQVSMKTLVLAKMAKVGRIENLLCQELKGLRAWADEEDRLAEYEEAVEDVLADFVPQEVN